MTQATDWTQTFFTGFMVETLPLMMASKEQTQQEADFLAGVFDRPAARVLDVPCGNGRLTLALAERGLDVTGVDLTPPFLEDARRGAAERGLRAAFEQCDMRALPWTAAFDCAFCFGNSFAYFDDAGNQAFLQAVQRALKPGGTFVVETHLVAEAVLSLPLKPFWTQLGDLYFLHQTRYDPAAATLTSTYTLIRGGTVEIKQAVYRIYTYREIVKMVREAGFAGVVAYGSLKREAFQLGSTALRLVATKAS
jgi:SAM-dependent methyltransferase